MCGGGGTLFFSKADAFYRYFPPLPRDPFDTSCLCFQIFLLKPRYAKERLVPICHLKFSLSPQDQSANELCRGEGTDALGAKELQASPLEKLHLPTLQKQYELSLRYHPCVHMSTKGGVGRKETTVESRICTRSTSVSQQ